MKGKIKKFFTPKRIVLFSIIGALIAAIIIIAIVSSARINYNFDYARNFYKTKEIADCPQGVNITVTTDNMKAGSGEIKIVEGTESGYTLGKTAFINADEKAYSDVLITVNVTAAGNYFIKLDYKILTDTKQDNAFALLVNGKYPTKEFNSIPLSSFWMNEEENFHLDSLGNEVLPMQKSVEGFYSSYMLDLESRLEQGLPVPLNEGKNELVFKMMTGKIYLGNLNVESIKNLSSYEEYKTANKNSPNEAKTAKVIEAEKPLYKNNISILPINNKDINVQPYNTYKTLLNMIDFKEAGDMLSYEFEISEPGFYKIGLNVSSAKANTTAYRKILIDGKVPFGELMHYPFGYQNGLYVETLGGASGDYEIYFSRGKHTLTLEVDGVVMNEITSPLKETSKKISKLYLDLKKLVGTTPDKDRDWIVTDYFPNIVSDLNSYITVLDKQLEVIEKFNGNKARNQAAIYLDSAKKSLKKLLEKPDKIPNNIALLSEGTSSIVQSLSSAVLDVNAGNLSIDRIFVTPTDKNHSYSHKPGIVRFFEEVKFFFYSFGGNFKVEKEEGTIEIWVNRPMQNISLMQRMADSDFTKKTGTKVRISMLKDEGKLVLANASGINPDGVIGVSSWIPYEMGLRDLIYEMNDLPGVKDVLRKVSPGSLMPLIVDGKILGIPESQDVSVMFYRKDILDNLGINVPSSWDDVREMLPVLQRNGMNFYLPTSSPAASKAIATTAPFIYQNGGDLYSSDAMTTAINDKKAMEGFKNLTDLYTVYGLPQQVSNFVESFREGTIPIGIGSLPMYAQLLVSAPELMGLWDIALAPGETDENGVIQRWNSGGSTVSAIMKKSKYPEKVWDFINWWMSTEVQINYGQQCQAVWGNQFIWASANVDAFKTASYEKVHKDVILEQWKWLMEVPRIPGWYMIERELSNAWNKVVIDGFNVVWAMEESVQVCNKEISRKMHEFGYMENGKVIKPYDITTLEEIVEWIG